MFKVIKRFAICIDGVTTSLIIVEFTPVSFRRTDRYSRNKCMDGRAWFNALVLKTSVPLGTVGSNPTPYAYESA